MCACLSSRFVVKRVDDDCGDVRVGDAPCAIQPALYLVLHALYHTWFVVCRNVPFLDSDRVSLAYPCGSMFVRVA